MAAKLMKMEELEEGEYEAPFGRVIVSRTEGGYKIVAYISERELEKNEVKQMIKSLLNPDLGGSAV